MSDPNTSKDIWDIISSITPLLIGIAVTGIGTIFTSIYNRRQLELNRITTLDKLRPLLISEKTEDREFGYASFVALGHEDIAIKIIKIQKDESGRNILETLKQTGPSQIQQEAALALSSLDKARKIVIMNEFGENETIDNVIAKNPELAKEFAEVDSWTKKVSRRLNIKTKLGIAILYDTAIHSGIDRTETWLNLKDSSTPMCHSREDETALLIKLLDSRDDTLKHLGSSLYDGIKPRIERFRDLLRAGDWDLQSSALSHSPYSLGR